MDKEKKCNNECRSGWCCRWEFFLDPMSRYDKDSVKLIEMKGGQVLKHPTVPNYVIVALPVKCQSHTDTGCKLRDNRPDMCKIFPREEHKDWVLSKHCVYYKEGDYYAFEDMKPYKPEN